MGAFQGHTVTIFIPVAQQAFLFFPLLTISVSSSQKKVCHTKSVKTDEFQCCSASGSFPATKKTRAGLFLDVGCLPGHTTNL